VSWGSGSHLQAVTACEEASTDPNALWQLGSGFGATACAAGDVIKCGDTISLRHVNTQKYIRSSSHRAPLSGRQEVSGGDGTHASVDNWILTCVSAANGAPLMRETQFRLRHASTGMNLYTRLQDKFTNANCRGCPIVNHLEVSASGVDDRNAVFKAGDGYYFPVDEERVVRDYHDLSAPKEGDVRVEKDEL
jgi:hypothetical protein